jgi:hypothetical protein
MGTKLFFVLIMFLGTIVSAFSQSRWSVGAFGGVGQSFNLNFSNYYNQKAAIPDYSYGLNASLRVGNKHRIRFESSIDKIGIERNWDVSEAETSTNQPQKSTLNVFYFNLGFRFDYRIFNHNKLNIYLSPALKTFYRMSDYEKTEYTIIKDKTSNYLNINYKENITAGALQLLITYDLTKHLKFTLAPEYMYAFDKFYYKCDNTLQQISCRAGFEWNF